MSFSLVDPRSNCKGFNLSVEDLSIINSDPEGRIGGDLVLFLKLLGAGEVFFLAWLRAGEVVFEILSSWIFMESLTGLSRVLWGMNFEESLFPLKVWAGVRSMELKNGIESMIAPICLGSSGFRRSEKRGELFTGDLNLEVFKGESWSGLC